MQTIADHTQGWSVTVINRVSEMIFMIASLKMTMIKTKVTIVIDEFLPVVLPSSKPLFEVST